MTAYSQRVRESILPLSQVKKLPDAFDKWGFTEATIDHGATTIETCKLCDKEQLCYHFEIRNYSTNHTLMAGSHCILRFNLRVYENGVRLSQRDAKMKLDRMIKRMHAQSCIRSLERVSAMAGGSILPAALAYYKERGFLTPKFAFVVLWKLAEHGIDHNPKFFKARINSENPKSDLRTMPRRNFLLVWQALSAQQQRLAISLGQEPPESGNG